ncbi:NAD-dependent dihydropyrimidine dehydrogenase subunit PreA [Alicyclobacillus mali (ex Roth et al. 2021)]|uniref:NAD-dependent dihydropyrimidine dehydrogenase subunit PreA n=1 Tax=Alicyclobacillus mali (ex Roth et al. 2021) TaxID=1123961 RepID=UPI00082F4C98|nr:NAD-dependent dihydropyrimidine dehydrogenase subunit PreA [Alicyclobacillus mali (ex Roth et al. 2021)]
MADLTVEMAGIRSPNPFWLASAPPTNTGFQVERAFEAGWGGAVWKTLTDRPVRNVSSRFGSLHLADKRMVGFNNIELISDRPFEDNLAEIRQVKRRFPDRAVVASLMIEPDKKQWQEAVRKVEDAGVDGIELNFGCPHGMVERGMGAAVGQHPDLIERQTSWVKSAATVPVIAKLTPNVTDIRASARAAVAGGADAISLINTINSIIGVDLKACVPRPTVAGLGTHGGYCGPAVKPIALYMVAECAKDDTVGVPISGIGGIATWQDAVEFLLLGAWAVQVCTAVMQHGFRIIEDLVDGLNRFLDDNGIGGVRDIVGKALPNYVPFGSLDLDHRVVAAIDADRCIGCYKCYIACLDAAHQAIAPGDAEARVPSVLVDECVGCNLCEAVCPVACIEMVPMAELAGAHPLTSVSAHP